MVEYLRGHMGRWMVMIDS